MKKGKSVLRWWPVLADNYGWLWKNNLLYLLCIAPSAICGFLFFLFHAYLFLSVFGLILAGPGLLAIYHSTRDATLETPKTVQNRFADLYRKHFRRGCLAGSILAAGMILIGMPIYFALSINSPIFPALLCFGGMWLLLWLSSSYQVFCLLCTEDKFSFSELLQKVFEPGVVGIVFGLVKLAWGCLCVFVPAFAVALAILGLPTVLRFSILYYIYV